VLATCGAGLAALAGCGEVEVDMGEQDEREYDASALSAIVEGREVPTRPDAFPVRVDGELVDRHYDRARELVDAVPERPDVPNGTVVERLREQRGRVVDDLDDPRDATTGRRRLEDARDVRGEAAEVNGAYHAAVGEVDRAEVAQRRRTLRADLHGFESTWAYRGATPSETLVFHAELERLRRAVRRSAEAWPPFPADPRDDVFRVGEIEGNLETGWTTLADADRLRTRYLEAIDEPEPFRSSITAATYRLDRRTSMRHRRAGEYLDVPATALPFERSVDEGTPAAMLYERARRGVENASEAAELSYRAGEPARATLRGARELASRRAFGAVLDAVEAGEYAPPEDAERLATARSAALAALREAWRTEPVAVSAEVAGPARQSLASAYFRLEGADGQAFEANDALADFAYARLYAEALPAVVGSVVAALDGGG
jgi:hypothetical protein